MDSLKLKEERSQLTDSLETMVDLAQSEGRELTTEEGVEFDTKTSKIADINKNIERAEKLESMKASMAATSGVDLTPKAPKEESEYRFTDAVKAAYTGRMDGLVKEMDAEARLQEPNRLIRGVAIPMNVLQQRADANAVAVPPVDLGSYTDQLFANSVLREAGANIYTGMSGDRKMPIVQNVASSWVAESTSNVTEVEAVGDLTSVSLEPKKLISVVNMTSELLVQNTGAEAAFRRNMAASQIATLEKALLQAGATTTGGPDSIFNDATDITGDALTAALAYTMEGNLIGAGVNPAIARMGFLFNANALATAKGLAAVSSVSPLVDPIAKTCNGYNYYVSSNVGFGGAAADQVLFADFSRFHVGVFGSLDLIFDPYSLAGAGLGRIVANSLFDGVATTPTVIANKITS
jgi:HK97 family phage major capsid protein